MPPEGSFGAYADEDFVKPRGGRKWLKRSFYIVLAPGGRRRRPVRRLPLDPDPVLRRLQGRARRALPGHQPGPGLGLALEGREGPPRDRTQVPPALPAQAGRGDDHRGSLGKARDEDRRARRPGHRLQEGRAAPRGRRAREHRRRPARARPAAPPASPTTQNATDQADRSHSHSGPHPLGGGAEAGPELRKAVIGRRGPSPP